MLRTLTLIAALAAIPAGARGQAADHAWDSAQARLVPGTRVRVSATSLDRRATGVLARAPSENLLIVRDDGTVLSVSASDVRRLEVSAGTRHHSGLGLAIGLGAGLVGGIAAYKSDYEEDCGTGPFADICESGNTLVLLSIPVLVAGGGYLGYRIGRAIKSERWEPVSPGRLDARVTWVDGPGVAVSIGL